jgi:hypothetical protein
MGEMGYGRLPEVRMARQWKVSGLRSCAHTGNHASQLLLQRDFASINIWICLVPRASLVALRRAKFPGTRFVLGVCITLKRRRIPMT